MAATPDVTVTPGVTAPPDVTVVVAVYNTMPYLTECLNSLLGQSIGHERLEVIAVDDGSTDDSGRELDRFAAEHPDVITVVHQPNSGGPAAPSNRALELATGRFVYFIGSDDHLGEEALERMVACADADGSDVVVGRMAGVNGRYVHQKLYKEGRREVTLFDSALPFTLANTKLFRRELVEKYGLRFPEDMPVGSDQPFTIEACVRARRISVLADYTYYYAVKRGDASNITYRADHLSRLRCTARIMDHTAGLIPAGPRRDAVLRRHFEWELSKLMLDDFPALPLATRREICEGLTALLDTYFTDGLREATGVKRRVRFGLARRGAVEELTRAIADEAEHGAPPFLLEGDRAFAPYPGFRDAAVGLDDRWYEVREPVAGRLAAGTELESAAWEQEGDGLALALKVRIGITGDTDSAFVALARGALPKSADKPGARRLPEKAVRPEAVGEFTREPADDGTGTLLTARIPVDRVRAERGVRVYVDVAGTTYEIPVRTGGLPLPLARRWGRTTPYRASANRNPKGRLVITTALLWEPAPPVGVRLRRMLSRLKRKVTR
ncbi:MULTISPECIES: glycosyltransferase family A protein [Streptomyces]|uniref:glycosyltransferase family 2 protein n=1 Tax=Streptomyces TaxID=1883 RepID=UPI00103F4E52|nr:MULTISPECIES: glycosyltransferase family A protein [Streptomyces]MBT3073693.1 glycosyltransferase family 2 protein [Streptomyces sp. COG21]MBT3083606.1 glycosyltransferase family 2 protein [Streptomyces sp. COG20]MBT3086190.1 glycosyltransferase family 2 protein [Streptomyces sp. CYG21]MBT3100085.1 glycosyltransferase family 2 protein [Streptomyces sp. CBG30]MBT3101754.1 glycosyltransferase family 2 protein [Streptomyces sp. COG19]